MTGQSNPGGTHWEGCWEEHRECALARIKVLEEENERLRQQKVRVDEWGLQMLEPLGDFLRKSLAADHPMTTHIEARFSDTERVPILHLWATTSETEPAARCRELAMARENAIAQREALRSRCETAEGLLREVAESMDSLVAYREIDTGTTFDEDRDLLARLDTFLAPQQEEPSERHALGSSEYLMVIPEQEEKP